MKYFIYLYWIPYSMVNENLIVSIWKKDEFANKIAKAAGQQKELSQIMQSANYKNQEYNPWFQVVSESPENLSGGIDAHPYTANGNNVYIIAPFNPIEGYTPQEAFARTLLAAGAAKQNSAKKVVVVWPDLIYGRSDRDPIAHPDKMGGKSFSLDILARTYAAIGVDHVLTLHPHSKSTSKIFADAYSEITSQEVKGEDVITMLSPVPILAHYLVTHEYIKPGQNGENALLLIPDDGAIPINDDLFDTLQLEGLTRVYCDKTRTKPNDANYVSVSLKGSPEVFKDKDVLFIDDAIDTCGTLVESFQHVQNAKSRVMYATHPWLAGNHPDDDAQKRLYDSNLDTIIIGTTHPDRVHTMSDDLLNNKVVFIDYAKYFSDAIVHCLSNGELPDERYSFKNLAHLLQDAGSLYDVVDNRTKKE